MIRSTFSYKIEEKFIIVIDEGRGMSVTNDLENVAKYIENESGINIRDYYFIYKDSEGNYDGVVFKNDYSPKFVYLNAKELSRAKSSLLSYL